MQLHLLLLDLQHHLCVLLPHDKQQILRQHFGSRHLTLVRARYVDVKRCWFFRPCLLVDKPRPQSLDLYTRVGLRLDVFNKRALSSISLHSIRVQ